MWCTTIWSASCRNWCVCVGGGKGAPGSLVVTSSSQRRADKESDQMAATARSRDSFNQYICELEQVGRLGCQYRCDSYRWEETALP